MPFLETHSPSVVVISFWTQHTVFGHQKWGSRRSSRWDYHNGKEEGKRKGQSWGDDSESSAKARLKQSTERKAGRFVLCFSLDARQSRQNSLLSTFKGKREGSTSSGFVVYLLFSHPRHLVSHHLWSGLPIDVHPRRKYLQNHQSSWLMMMKWFERSTKRSAMTLILTRLLLTKPGNHSKELVSTTLWRYVSHCNKCSMHGRRCTCLDLESHLCFDTEFLWTLPRTSGRKVALVGLCIVCLVS